MTLAYRLAKKGFNVSVFEKEETLGGLARIVPFENASIEAYYHHIFNNDVDVIELIDELNLSDKLVWKFSKMGLFYQGKLYPFGKPMDLFGLDFLSLVDKFKFGLNIVYLQRKRTGKKFDGVPASHWLKKYSSKKVFQTVWEPLLKQKFEEESSEISMAWFWGKMRTRGASRRKFGSKEQLGYITGSFGVLIEALKEKIIQYGGQIHCNSEVCEFVISNDDVSEIITNKGKTSFDIVINTLPIPVFLGITPHLPSEYRKKLSAIKYKAVVCLLLELDRPLSDLYWTNISSTDFPFGVVVEHTNCFDDEKYNGKKVIYFSKYLNTDQELYHFSEEHLLNSFLPYITKINPKFETSWIRDIKAFRDEYAQPIMKTNYLNILPDFQTPIKNLYLGTIAQIYPEDRGLNYSVRLGNRIANHIIYD
ncbi:hypothetical protein LCGC14_0800210 [marine sediment metagenome]|uniref:Amine oxidase domain-containing protein n=1 Tax=marine sediment metagenome TaxID=412755 RepID=A0A0F9SX25_9ZZZZ